MEVNLYTGAEIGAFIEPLGRYLIEIFREFPYLYDGDMDYERHYLSRYLQSDESFLLLGQDASGIACACTGIPLQHETDAFADPSTGNVFVGQLIVDGIRHIRQKIHKLSIPPSEARCCRCTNGRRARVSAMCSSFAAGAAPQRSPPRQSAAEVTLT